MHEMSQAEKFGVELSKLNRDVTKEDRLEAMKALNIKSPATISNYLNGKVRDSDMASRLLLFLKSRIEQRNLLLA